MPEVSSKSVSMQKKPSASSSRRGTAIRDISARKKPTGDSFKIHHLEEEREIPTVNPNAGRQDGSQMVEVEGSGEEGIGIFDADAGVLEETDQDARSVISGDTSIQIEPKELVKVKFAKFVQLVTARDCADIVASNEEENVVMSSNLLTELAGAHDEREEKKIPLVFLVGLAIGVILTYILITK